MMFTMAHCFGISTLLILKDWLPKLQATALALLLQKKKQKEQKKNKTNKTKNRTSDLDSLALSHLASILSFQNLHKTKKQKNQKNKKQQKKTKISITIHQWGLMATLELVETLHKIDF